MNSHTDHVAITEAKPEDEDAIRALYVRSSRANLKDRHFLDNTPRALILPESTFTLGTLFVARGDDGRIIGFAKLAEPDGDLAEVEGLFVDPDHWRRRVGTRLAHACIAHATEAGYATLRLTANANAHPFYHALGFQETVTVPVSTGPATVFELRLKEAG